MSSQYKKRDIYKPVVANDTDECDDVIMTPRRGLFNSPVFFATISMIQAALGIAAMAYFGACLSTIEKRFQLKSSQSGIIVATNDAVGLVIILFVTHYGKSRHRPRIIGALYVTVALGSLVHSIPHLIYGIPPSLGKGIYKEDADVYEPGLCMASNDTDECTADEVEQSGSLLYQAGWLFVGQALASCFSCTYPLYLTYLDDGVTKRALAVYMGFYYSTFAFGAALGFGLATVCLSLPAYISNEDYVSSVLSNDDPRWIGAWWLGFLIIGSAQLLVSIPLFCFPKFLPKVKDDEDDDDINRNEYLTATTEKVHFVQEEVGLIGFLKGLLKSIWRVVTNPTVLCLIICFVFLSGFISSFPLFGAKYIQFQFGVRPEIASIVFGAVLLPAGVTGNIVGGFLIKRFAQTRLQLATILLVISTACVMVDPLALFLGCQNKDIAGLTVHYPTENIHTNISDLGSPDGIDSSCNADCDCPILYDPICGADGITYSSPCHAGCQGSLVISGNGTDLINYINCSCITQRYVGNEGNPSLNDDVAAIHGECKQPCNMFIPYLVSYFVMMFLGPMCANPATLLKLRSVNRSDRSMSISVSDITGKLFGFIPGPIYYGAAIDTACLLFQSSCGKTGNCLVYDIEKFRYVFYGITLTLQVLSTFSIFACYLTVKLDKKSSKKEIVESVPLRRDIVN